jgi:hypothetical protein
MADAATLHSTESSPASALARLRHVAMRGRLIPAPVFLSAAVAILALQVILVSTHVPWLDEWQALQIAVQSPDYRALLDNLHYEGHPPLWYALLRGAAALVGPAHALAAVQVPIALALQSIILFRSPFRRLERLLIASGFFVLFDYGVLSRSLSLGVLLTTVAIAFRRNRLSWFAVALMPMADFLFGVLSALCIAIRWRERRLWTPGILLWLATGLLATWTVWPAPDLVPAFTTTSPLADLGTFITRLSVLLVPLPMANGVLVWNHPLPLPIAVVAGPLFLYFADHQLRCSTFHRTLFHGFVAIALLVSVLLYPLAIRHLSLIAWLLILLVWIAREAGAEPSPAFRLWLAAGAACGLLTAAVNLVRPFDTAPQAAAVIRAKGLTEAHWIAFPESRGQGVSALTGMEFERLPLGCTESFVRWNVHASIGNPRALAQALRQTSERRGRLYLLTDLDLDEVIRPPLLVPIAAIAQGYDGQAYRLYVVRPDLPETPYRPPACPPVRRPLG